MFNFSSGGGVSLLHGHLVRYLIFAITPLRMHRLGSFFNIMRISSSATNGIKGVCFCSAVFEKLTVKLDPRLTPEEGKHYIENSIVTYSRIHCKMHFHAL